jgi:rRNA-processing protein FCF1
LRKREIEIGSRGDYTLTDEEAQQLSKKIVAKYESNALTELAVKNFSVVYDLPDVRLRFITLMTCLESLFNLGKDQIAHAIARHLSIILSNTKEQFKEEYVKIKKLYNQRNSIVHGGEHKGELMQDYLELSNKVRAAINFCNDPDLTKEKLFEDLNSRGF